MHVSDRHTSMLMSLGKLGLFFPNLKLDEEVRLGAWIDELWDLDPGLVAHAVDLVIHGQDRWPTVHTLRLAALSTVDQSLEADAGQAWGLIMRTILDDSLLVEWTPLMRDALATVVRFRDLKQGTTAAMWGHRKLFHEAFNRLQAQEVARKTLPAIVMAEHRRLQSPPEPPRELRDPREGPPNPIVLPELSGPPRGS